jgi:threonine/homoserine/homoserine lactone efflux protein
MSIEFLLTSLIVVVSPGTGVLYTLAAALSHGARAGVIAAFACTLGILPHMAAAITGLAALLHTSALAFQTLKYLGVAYLLYIAWSTLKERGPLRLKQNTGARSVSQVIVSGILINILNPKLSIFFFAFLPLFVSADEPHALARMLELSAVFMALTFVVFVAYATFAAAVRNHVVALGARLALADR